MGVLDSAAFAKIGKKFNTIDKMTERIQAAGFANIHEKPSKPPIGNWARDVILKEAGNFNKQHFEEAMEGYAV